MSSLAVRTGVLQFLEDNSAESVVDLTAQWQDLKPMLAENDIQPSAPWLGVEFVGDEEDPVSLSADNEKGLYREYGLVQLHVVAIGKIGAGADMINRAEALRNLFRGRRIGDIVVLSVSPLNTGPGATLEFEGGYVSGTVTVTYHFDLTPGA